MDASLIGNAVALSTPPHITSWNISTTTMTGITCSEVAATTDSRRPQRRSTSRAVAQMNDERLQRMGQATPTAGCGSSARATPTIRAD